MRWTKGVSVWPVGLTGAARFAGPIVKDGKVVDFHTNWAPNRSFPLDMAGFSINLKLLVKEKPWVNFNAAARRGYLEPSFLEQLTTRDQLEPLADNCTKVCGSGALKIFICLGWFKCPLSSACRL